MIGLPRAGRAAVVGVAATLVLGLPAWGDAAPADQSADVAGAWTAPFVEDGGASPTAVEAAVLGDGRIFYFDGSGARLLDLRSGTPQFSPIAPAGDVGDLTLSALTALPDGRILMAGPSPVLFDPVAGSFSPAPAMTHGRRYPHVAIGPDGKATVFGGATDLAGDTQFGRARRTETYHPERNAWQDNHGGPESESGLPLQPRIVLAPNGKFFYAAAGQAGGPAGGSPDDVSAALFQFFDPETKKWETTGVAPFGARSGAFVVPLTLEPPYDRMAVVSFGGVLGPGAPGTPANPFTTLTSIDANGNVTNRTAGDLNHPRWYPSGVLLPDGKILAVGGADKDDSLAPGLGVPVRTPELYDPSTTEWTEVAPHQGARGYHNSALLLPDMRVLLGGSDPGFEVWTPPYLFRGPRPRVTTVQRAVGYRETFDITTPDAGLIESVVLLRTPSPDHANDSDQRALRLEFTRRGPDLITATAPPSGAVAPPGTYYLVVNKKSLQGPIPSVARMVEVGRTDRADAPQPYRDDPPAPAAPIGPR